MHIFMQLNLRNTKKYEGYLRDAPNVHLLILKYATYAAKRFFASPQTVTKGGASCFWPGDPNSRDIFQLMTI